MTPSKRFGAKYNVTAADIARKWPACASAARGGQAIAKAKIKLDRLEVRKFAALGYLDRSMMAAEKGPALDQAVEAYLSNKSAEELASLALAPST